MTQNITLPHLQDSAYRFREPDTSFPTGLRVVQGKRVTVQQTWQNYIQSLEKTHTHTKIKLHINRSVICNSSIL